MQLKKNLLNEKFVFQLRKMTKFFYNFRGLCRISEFIRRYYGRLPDGKEFLVKDFDKNLFFYCRLNEHISSWIFWKGTFAEDELKLLKNILKKDDIVIDIGANKGVFTLVSAKLVPNGKVISFEPALINYAILKKNILANKFNNIISYKMALGNIDSETMLFAPAGDYKDGTKNEGVYSLYKKYADNGSLPDEMVKLNKLDNVWPGLNLKTISLIKIDAEGSEYEIFKGMENILKVQKPKILIEINAKGLKKLGYSIDEMLNYLRGLGYKFKSITDTRSDNLNNFETKLHRDILGYI